MRGFLVLVLLSFVSAGFAAQPGALPKRFLLTVPQFDEITGLNCGPAALESVFAYWGADISQREIANVARTSSIGTYVYDTVRAGHFSSQSAAQGRFYPHEVPVAGYANRALGYAAFGHAQPTPWLDGLKALVAQGIPPILLMRYSTDPTSGGHYRVMVGYDDERGEAYFIDPWGRDLNRVVNPDGTVTWKYADLITAWTYPEYGSPYPYYATIIVPWSVKLTVLKSGVGGRNLTIDAHLSYPCPEPFDCASYPADSVTATLQLPAGVSLISPAATVTLGDLGAGRSAAVRWRALVTEPRNASEIRLTASGYINGHVPEAFWTGGQVYYPAYFYRDRIGGVASARLTAP
ncbi:MAG: C39 family peptidase [Pseudomonadota bacterium]